MHRHRSAAIAFLSVLLAFSFQWAVVHTAYQSNWTALFCPGDLFTRPPEIQQHEYVFHNSGGYDGQFYQLIAHDPFFALHYDRYIDAPRLRYRRILMPGMAYLLAAGQPPLIDWAYFAVCWCFIALGTFCLAELAVDEGRSPLWGLLFLIAPATLAALERMTVNISLTALLPAVLLAARRQRWLLLWLALAAAMLAKETGLILIVGVVLWLARQKNFRLAATLGSSVLPAVAWYLFVQSRSSGDYSTADFTFSAFLAVLTPPLPPGVINLVYRIASVAAAVAVIWAAVLGILLAFRNRLHDLVFLLSFFFAVLVMLFQNRSIWVEPTGYTRIYSPLLVCLIAATWRRGFTQALVVYAIAALPLGMQLGVHRGPVIAPATSLVLPTGYS